MAEVTVQVLGEEDWQAYRRMRLASLREDPDAFVASLAEEQEYAESLWRTRMQRSRRLLARRDGDDAGVVSVGPARDEDDLQEGIAELFGMWVVPQLRGTGVAWQLVTAAADQARRDGHRHLRLWVGTDNGRAIGFYSSYGFRPADDRRPMRTDDSLEEIAMTLPLA
jgi:ribosomal protein S18 acetylase RimI-like enzyme